MEVIDDRVAARRAKSSDCILMPYQGIEGNSIFAQNLRVFYPIDGLSLAFLTPSFAHREKIELFY